MSWKLHKEVDETASIYLAARWSGGATVTNAITWIPWHNVAYSVDSLIRECTNELQTIFAWNNNGSWEAATYRWGLCLYIVNPRRGFKSELMHYRSFLSQGWPGQTIVFISGSQNWVPWQPNPSEEIQLIRFALSIMIMICDLDRNHEHQSWLWSIIMIEDRWSMIMISNHDQWSMINDRRSTIEDQGSKIEYQWLWSKIMISICDQLIVDQEQRL